MISASPPLATPGQKAGAATAYRYVSVAYRTYRVLNRCEVMGCRDFWILKKFGHQCRKIWQSLSTRKLKSI